MARALELFLGFDLPTLVEKRQPPLAKQQRKAGEIKDQSADRQPTLDHRLPSQSTAYLQPTAIKQHRPAIVAPSCRSSVGAPLFCSPEVADRRGRQVTCPTRCSASFTGIGHHFSSWQLRDCVYVPGSAGEVRPRTQSASPTDYIAHGICALKWRARLYAKRRRPLGHPGNPCARH